MTLIAAPPSGVCFNPPPAVGPGETAALTNALAGPARFQSAPGGGAGGNAPALYKLLVLSCFNPPPAVGPGETGRGR